MAGRVIQAVALSTALALTSCASRHPATYPITHDEKLLDFQLELAESHNKWIQFANSSSAASPDHQERLRQLWIDLKISEKFRRVERELGVQ